jgi:hypothetical protein
MFFTPVLVCVVVLVILVNSFRKKGKDWEYLRTIPQPPRYPIVGNLLDLMRPQELMFEGDRKRSLLYYPIYKLDIFGMYSVNLLHPEDIEVRLFDW